MCASAAASSLTGADESASVVSWILSSLFDAGLVNKPKWLELTNHDIEKSQQANQIMIVPIQIHKSSS